VVPLRRPSELGQDDSPAIDFVKHALAAIEGRTRLRYDAIAILQPTTPLTQPEDIDRAFDLFVTTRAESVVTVCAVQQALHPAKLKRLVDGWLEPYWPGELDQTLAQRLIKAYTRNGAVYLARRGLVERGLVIGERCLAVEMPRERSVDINDAYDMAVAEHLVARFGQNVARLTNQGAAGPQPKGAL
jgi:CMP-N-acetylneuraminic acid synthetase